jgi:adenosylhomocysteine nucleosidase
LAPWLSRGDLVVPEAVLEGQERHPVLERLPGREARGELVTAAAVLTTPEQKARLYAETGALACDMESAPILAAARGQGWAALVVRAVSDDAREGLPAGLLRAVDSGGRLDVGRALLAMTVPGNFRRALALRRDTAVGLAAVAEAVRPLVG